ncbi:MAG: hypothetical protein ACRD50_10260 [Candidatus Acidiferrales bacterium]
MRPKLACTLVAIFGVCVCAGRARAQTASSAEPATTAISHSSDTAGKSALPTAEEILEKFANVSGGHAAWSGFTTLGMKGIYQTEDQSGFAGIEILIEAPNKKFIKITLQNGATVYEVCDGKSAWIEDPRGGIHEFTGAALESRMRDASIHSGAEILLGMPHGHVLGEAQVGTHSTYVVELSPEKKFTSKVYFDTTSGFPVRADDTFHRDDGDYTVETDTEDFRAVEGAYFPYRIRHVEKGNVFTIRITQVKKNPPVDDAIFVKPDSSANER